MPPIDAERLRLAMLLRRVNAADVAEAIGVNPSYLSQLLDPRNKRRLERNPELRRRIADFLEVPLDWIEESPGDPALDASTATPRRQHRYYTTEERNAGVQFARQHGLAAAAERFTVKRGGKAMRVPRTTIATWLRREGET